MTRIVLRPRRRLKYELYMLGLVFLMPVAVVAVFPYEAIGFTPSVVRPEPAPVCAFVRLSDEAVENAIDESRACWKVDTKLARSMRLELADDIPEEDAGGVLPFSERRKAPPRGPVAYRVSALPPTLAAPAAARLEPAAAAAAPAAAFAREELLRLPEFDLKGKNENDD